MKELSVSQMEEINGGQEPIWKCLAGTVGTGILGVLAGGWAGPVGGILGGGAGILVGAAEFC